MSLSIPTTFAANTLIQSSQVNNNFAALLNHISNAEVTASTVVIVNGSQNLASVVAVPVANGGTAVTSVTTAPTASSFAGWDASSNLSANNFIPGYATAATASATTTLTVTSPQQQYFTGTTVQTVVMPVTSTLALGLSYSFLNSSTGVITINSSGGNLILSLPASSSAILTCILITGTTAASWQVTTFNIPVTARYSSSVATTVSNSGTTTIPFATKQYDSANAMVTASGNFVIPIAGVYSVKGLITFASAAYAQNNAIEIYILKNGSNVTTLVSETVMAVFTGGFSAPYAGEYAFAVGDTLAIGVLNNRTAGSTNLLNNAAYNHVAIARVGS